jgi:hypothetical protein
MWRVIFQFHSRLSDNGVSTEPSSASLSAGVLAFKIESIAQTSDSNECGKCVKWENERIFVLFFTMNGKFLSKCGGSCAYKCRPFFIYFQFSIFFLNFYLPFIFISKKRTEIEKCHVVRRHWPLMAHYTSFLLFFLYSFLWIAMKKKPNRFSFPSKQSTSYRPHPFIINFYFLSFFRFMVNETYHGWLTFAVKRKINGVILMHLPWIFLFFSWNFGV